MHSYRLAAAAAGAILMLGAGAAGAWAGDNNEGGQPNDKLPVFLDRLVDVTAQDPCSIPPPTQPPRLWQGSGNPATTFQRKRNVDAGIELAIKGIIRGGADIRSSYVDGDGLVHIEVPAGVGAPGRAIWNFTYSYDVALDPTNLTLDNYDAELWIDLDSSDKTDYLKLNLAKLGSPSAGTCAREPDLNGYGWKAGNTVVIPDDEGTDHVTQNSQNLGFYSSLLGGYAFGPGQFDVVMTIKQKSGRNRHHDDDHGDSKTTLHVVFDVVTPPTPTP